MISNEPHKKHADLKRPAIGNFARNEWAIVGAPCVYIKGLADKIIQVLSPIYKCAYVDSSHNDEVILPPGRLANGAFLEYTDQISHQQFNYSEPLKLAHLKRQLAEADIVLINGNHQQAKAQVVIIYENKRASLQKRLEQLTDIQLVLLAENTEDIFDFIQEKLVDRPEVPVYRLEETEKIISFFQNKLELAKPRLNGLVLAGGKSQRMGFDKGTVNWFGKEQRFYMADVLKSFCGEIFISCRDDQRSQIPDDYNVLPDTFTGLGPYGAILSGFREQPDRAWLVIACDLPLLDADTIQCLVDQRDTSKIATTFNSPDNEFPEPLITIWEPKSYPVLLTFLSQGYSCPRKVLINSDVKLINAENPEVLTNVNTPEDLERVKRTLHQKIAST